MLGIVAVHDPLAPPTRAWCLEAAFQNVLTLWLVQFWHICLAPGKHRFMPRGALLRN